ncbi:response regulator transcription factor [Luteolibacter sp. LG18]|uniref:response regulator transcription factor n=1 Tax=Luteolibacter sp. LG18 TaxID=2819286 RepID=UPI002B28584F|nr:DNA-binding response regulator [Luteolibacter sp. LG18]
MNPITVLLVEDHLIVREGLRALLKMEADILVIGEAENGREAVDMVRKQTPDVVVMDMAMPLLNGMEATRQILRFIPSTKVLILSAHSDDAYVEKAAELGAHGYLTKQTAAHVLPEAIRNLHRGKTFFSPAISKRFSQPLKRLRDQGESPAKPEIVRLSPREMEVLQLIAEGKANKETAGELHISVKTVEKHRQSLMDKLGIHDTAGLTRYAIATGIIENGIRPF